MVAGYLDNHLVRYYFRPVASDGLQVSCVSCLKIFSSTEIQCVIVLWYARIKYTHLLYLNLYSFVCGRILRLVNLGHSKRECECSSKYVSFSQLNHLIEVYLITIWD